MPRSTHLGTPPQHSGFHRILVQGWEDMQKRGQAERKRLVVMMMRMVEMMVMMEIPVIYFLG